MAQRGRCKRSRGRGHAMKLDEGVDFYPTMGRGDAQQQNQQHRDEIGELRRQVAVLKEMVQHLHSPSEKEDSKLEYKIEDELLVFQGRFDAHEFEDWLNTLKIVFDYYEVPDSKKVQRQKPLNGGNNSKSFAKRMAMEKLENGIK